MKTYKTLAEFLKDGYKIIPFNDAVEFQNNFDNEYFEGCENGIEMIFTEDENNRGFNLFGAILKDGTYHIILDRDDIESKDRNEFLTLVFDWMQFHGDDTFCSSVHDYADDLNNRFNELYKSRHRDDFNRNEYRDKLQYLNRQKRYLDDELIEIERLENRAFVSSIADILGDNFFLCDMIFQDDLFAMQKELSDLIVKWANRGNKLALKMVSRLPNTFKTE